MSSGTAGAAGRAGVPQAVKKRTLNRRNRSVVNRRRPFVAQAFTLGAATAGRGQNSRHEPRARLTSPHRAAAAAGSPGRR
jgi:hypothetical protein